MAVTGLRTEEEAHRLLGQAINHSSAGRGADAIYAHECVVSLLDRETHEDVFNPLMGALTVAPEEPEFRRYCEHARNVLEVGE